LELEPQKVIRMASPLSSKSASNLMDTAARRNRLRRAILESLERRELMAYNVLAGAFAPNTTAEYRDTWTTDANKARGLDGTNTNGTGGPASPSNSTPWRWTNPTGGVSPGLGDPAVISWSIVPDGTPDAAESGNSNLIAFMDSIYGGRNWTCFATPLVQYFPTSL
jgi:hypothetical protein